LSGYELLSQDGAVVTVANNNTLVASIACPAGKNPLSGGWEPLLPTGTTTLNAARLNLSASLPTTTGWTINLRNNTGTSLSNVQVRMWVACAPLQ
jgi:hypothetical protein